MFATNFHWKVGVPLTGMASKRHRLPESREGGELVGAVDGRRRSAVVGCAQGDLARGRGREAADCDPHPLAVEGRNRQAAGLAAGGDREVAVPARGDDDAGGRARIGDDVRPLPGEVHGHRVGANAFDFHQRVAVGIRAGEVVHRRAAGDAAHGVGHGLAGGRRDRQRLVAVCVAVPRSGFATA